MSPDRNLSASGLSDDDLADSDSELAWAANEVACEWLDDAGGAYGSTVHLLPTHWRRVWTLLYLESQVNNGGFHQFFVNSGGWYDKHLLEDAATLKHDAYREVIQQAVAKYRGYDYAAQWANRGKDWDVFAQPNREGRFREEDNAFFGIEADVPQRPAGISHRSPLG